MNNHNCTWAVCFDIDGIHYDDRQPRTTIVAVFRYPDAAEDFIQKCLPVETRSRFYVKHLDD